MNHIIFIFLMIFNQVATAGYEGRARDYPDDIPTPNGNGIWYLYGFFFGIIVIGAISTKIESIQRKRGALKEAEKLPDRCYGVEYTQWAHRDGWKPFGYYLYYKIGQKFESTYESCDVNDTPFSSIEDAERHLRETLLSLGIPEENHVNVDTMNSLHNRIVHNYTPRT